MHNWFWLQQLKQQQQQKQQQKNQNKAKIKTSLFPVAGQKTFNVKIVFLFLIFLNFCSGTEIIF